MRNRVPGHRDELTEGNLLLAFTDDIGNPCHSECGIRSVVKKTILTTSSDEADYVGGSPKIISF
jgi:hypothetical protein